MGELEISPMWRLKRDVCVCLERGESIKGVVICKCRCIGAVKGQLVGLASASLSLWSFSSCISFLQTPDTFPGKLQHPPTAPGLLWPLLGSPVHSPGPYSPRGLVQSPAHPFPIPDALTDYPVPSPASSCSVLSAEIKALKGSRALPGFSAGYQLMFSFFFFSYMIRIGKRTFWKSGWCFSSH